MRRYGLRDDQWGRIKDLLPGREGSVGATPVLLGAHRTPHHCFIQAPGEMLAIDTAAFCAAVDQSPSLRKLLLRYAQVQFVQAVQTAFVNATYQSEVRLARWLLMCHDRVDGDELVMTHEFVSLMLGVQRSSTTLAIQSLEGQLEGVIDDPAAFARRPPRTRRVATRSRSARPATCSCGH